MRRIALALFALALASFAVPAYAQSDEDVLIQIETMHGQSEAFSWAFNALRESFYSGDAGTLADLAVYPLTVEANGEVYDLASAQDLIDNAQSLITPETAEALANQTYADLIINSDGVGLANGALWMALICTDDACSDSYWAVTRISN